MTRVKPQESFNSAMQNASLGALRDLGKAPDRDLARLWSLDPRVTYLNHGSFGACPIALLEKQAAIRAEMEANPMLFFEDIYEARLDGVRASLGRFLGANPKDFALVPNATTGVNSVLRSLKFGPGDELLTTNHEYNACRNALEFVAEQSGAKVVVARVELPVRSKEDVVEQIVSRVTDRTRLLLLDHVTSKTAIVFPLKEIIRRVSERGVDVLVDGAHAPGMIPLDLTDLGAAYYTGNCHKWMSSPRGAAFLYVRRDKQPQIRPLGISHGANSTRTDRSRFLIEFDWTGTNDPSALMCVGETIDYFENLLPNGWTDVRDRNDRLVREAIELLIKEFDLELACPVEMLGSMASLTLSESAPENLGRILRDEWRIEIPVHESPSGQGRYIRLSAQLYNRIEDYQRLVEALRNVTD